MMIRKDAWTKEASNALDKYQSQFTEKTKGVISKEMAIIRILEDYWKLMDGNQESNEQH